MPPAVDDKAGPMVPLLAVLNGLLGDHLARSGNGLAIAMEPHLEGRPIALTRAALAAAYPQATDRVVVLLHGLMTSESVWRFRDGFDYGAGLRDRCSATPLYLRYNSGLHVSDNGEALAALLERLVSEWPGPAPGPDSALREIILLGYSMGGLVARSACHAAAERGHRWLSRVRLAFYVGTPHLGAPLERLGHALTRVLGAVPDPVTRLLADIFDLRSDGVKDLGHGHLRRADWDAPPDLRDRHHPVPLLPHIRHHLIAGALPRDPRLALLFGDAIVPLGSATLAHAGHAPLPPAQVKVIPETHHLQLAHDPRVWEQLLAWSMEGLT